MAAIKVTNKFATAQDTAEVLGVSPARVKKLIEMVDATPNFAATAQRARPPRGEGIRKAGSTRRKPTHAAAKRRASGTKSAKSSR